MISITHLTSKIFDNKLRNGFPIDSPKHEFTRLQDEVKELEDALKTGVDKEIAGELADCFIFLASIAKIRGIDFETAIEEKIAYNSTRVYLKK